MSSWKNTLDGINGLLGTAEEKIHEIESITIETIQSETYREIKTNKNKERSNDLWDNFKRPNIQVIVILKWKERGEQKLLLEEILAEHIPNLLKMITPQSNKSMNTKCNIQKKCTT